MNPARLIVLIIAIGAGGIAAWLAGRSDPQPVAEIPKPQLETVDVLIAKEDIPLGQKVAAGQLQWQSWPASAANSSFIRRTDRPEATTQLSGSIARSPFIAGEPIRETKLVKAGDSGYMAAILPAGMRAISTEISVETSAGGFILPNDRVDVILSSRGSNPDQGGGRSEIILSNIRVLAIDQSPREQDGQNSVIGKTATLELRPDQAETLTRARQAGTIALALRSIADARPGENEDIRRNSINVVRFGVSTTTTTTK